ncbi:hypothetical protein FEI17_19485 [Kosakonia radicincitans]|uniref:Uncharacterized protein n=1 Tax=Kosakonia radicincitans TaxID=283686 RepID=A0AAX2EM33_9ENTR|nr:MULTISPECIES: hypothetical protein [Kosakonia]MDP9564954.1 hypothetical protein [Kosakonia oryzae]APG17053.1 hypothetical protein A3780_05575 [Kosakonia radicincitans]KDE33779.1 hypothetical protein AW40_25885 [Kosakonia radicincitans UMEnt01/12]MDD7997114.1 hypothetical protein [Kosakonia radicincitans]NCF04651.1 hypothetical protein [Kosakonia sp. MH5]
MKKKPHMTVNKVDFFDFRYELERAVLATDRDYSQQCLTRAKFLSYLLCRNLSHQYVVMFNETFSSAEIAVDETTNKKEKTRLFRDNFYRLKQALNME